MMRAFAVLHAEAAIKQGIAAFQLHLLGLDPVRKGWIAARHFDSSCDHIHIAESRKAFNRQRIAPRLSALQTDRNHITMAARLRLEPPTYFDREVPTLTPPAPARRLRDPRAAKLAADLEDVIRRYWPRNINEFDARLARCQLPILRHVNLSSRRLS